MKKNKTLEAWILSQIFSIAIIILIWYFSPMLYYVYIAIAAFTVSGLYKLFIIIRAQKKVSYSTKESDKKLSGIEWNIKNILILAGALSFMVASIIYGTIQADVVLKEKRKKLMRQSISEVADYIINHNNKRQIDPVTTIDHITYHNRTLVFNYQIKDGLLNKATSMIQSTKKFKERVTREVIAEDCSKVPFLVFLEKNGTIHYVYHKISNGGKTFMFDLNVTKEMCDK